MENLTKAYRLFLWEEVTGLLTKLREENGALFAEVGRKTVSLPIDIADLLRPHVGETIALLRTDNAARPYRFRSVDSKNAAKNSPAGAGNTDIGDENGVQTTGATE